MCVALFMFNVWFAGWARKKAPANTTKMNFFSLILLLYNHSRLVSLPVAYSTSGINLSLVSLTSVGARQDAAHVSGFIDLSDVAFKS